MNLNFSHSHTDFTLTWILVAFGLVLLVVGIIIGNRSVSNTNWGASATVGLSIIGVLVLVAGGAGSAIAAMSTADHAAESQYVSALMHAAKDTYGIQLSRQAALHMVPSAIKVDTNTQDQEFGTGDYLVGTTVHKAMLDHISNLWILVDAGTRTELPRV